MRLCCRARSCAQGVLLPVKLLSALILGNRGIQGREGCCQYTRLCWKAARSSEQDLGSCRDTGRLKTLLCSYFSNCLSEYTCIPSLSEALSFSSCPFKPPSLKSPVCSDWFWEKSMVHLCKYSSQAVGGDCQMGGNIF